MGKRWSIDEDLIVCRFYLKNKTNKKPNFLELFEIFRKRGLDRSLTTIKDRFYNYQYIHIGKGLSHASKQQRYVFELLTKNDTKI